ncbi:hypothetical protein SDC9_165053 [bioreactor metagenome]|uniref:Uncharacterized protein n=1 Tax=bioreactor metagenome TaxID=1076179 RepID=A0A645FTC4_9ZZZZ
MHRSVIAGGDAFHQITTHAGPGKDRFRQHGAGQQNGHLQAEQRDHRDERIVQRMSVDEHPFANATRTSRRYIVGLHGFDHISTGDTYKQTRLHQPQSNGGQDQVLQYRKEGRPVCADQRINKVNIGVGS